MIFLKMARSQWDEYQRTVGEKPHIPHHCGSDDGDYKVKPGLLVKENSTLLPLYDMLYHKLLTEMGNPYFSVKMAEI